MVKGISRRVVVVDSPDQRFFEQAIFIVRNDAAGEGVTARELPLSQSVMENALAAGEPIICSVGPGDFTTSGHFIVLAGLEDGKFQVRDPNRRSTSEELWDYDTLAGQITNLWAFSLA